MFTSPKKVGKSTQFTRFQQGSFEVINKMTDLTYLVNCGSKSSFMKIECAKSIHSFMSEEVNVHLFDEESEIESKSEEKDEFPGPEAPNASRPCGNANDLHGYMTMRVTSKSRH